MRTRIIQDYNNFEMKGIYMARDEITIQKPVIENTDSVGIEVVTPQAVTVANGITLKGAMECLNNTLFITINNTASSDSTVTIKKGEKFPNSMLGDLTLTAAKSAITVLQIQDPARFVNANCAIDIDFGTEFAGTIYAIGKKVGL